MIHRLLYFIKEAFKGMRHAIFPAVASISTIAVSLVLVWILALVIAYGGKMVQHIEENLSIFIFFKESAAQAKMDLVAKRLKKWPEVSSIKVFSREEAREQNRKLLPQGTKGLRHDEIPAQAYIELRLVTRKRDRVDFDGIHEELEKIKTLGHVDSVEYGEATVRWIFAVVDIGRFLGWIICSLVLFSALYFTFATIKLAVLARREEIEILKLIGATNGFIRAPFYIEGLFQGLSGSLLAILLVLVVENRFEQYVVGEHHLRFATSLLSTSYVLVALAAGVVVGWLGSFLSTRRYLRV